MFYSLQIWITKNKAFKQWCLVHWLLSHRVLYVLMPYGQRMGRRKPLAQLGFKKKRQISAVIFKNLSYINAQQTYNKLASCPSISVCWTLDQSFITNSLSKITWSRMILTFSHSLRKGLRMLTIFLPLRLLPVDVNTNKFDERIHVVAAQVDVFS